LKAFKYLQFLNVIQKEKLEEWSFIQDFNLYLRGICIEFTTCYAIKSDKYFFKKKWLKELFHQILHVVIYEMIGFKVFKYFTFLII